MAWTQPLSWLPWRGYGPDHLLEGSITSAVIAAFAFENALQRRRQTLFRFGSSLCRIKVESGLAWVQRGVWTMISAESSDPLNISLSTGNRNHRTVAGGLTNQEIADRLTISKRTVDNHVSNVFTKTCSKNRVALLNWAMDNGGSA